LTVRKHFVINVITLLTSAILGILLYDHVGKLLIARGWNDTLVFFGMIIIVTGVPVVLFNKLVSAVCPNCGGRAYSGNSKRSPYTCADCGAIIKRDN